MDLVERSLAEQHDELRAVELARPAEEIVVRQPAARQHEAFVEPAERIPVPAPMKSPLLSPSGANQPRDDDSASVAV